MNFRHEHKHVISLSERAVLRRRLSSIMKSDENGINGRYKIRSIYFDDIRDSALKEKINGVSRREKFRIRYYNGDLGYIILEKKSKVNNLCSKEKAVLTVEQVKDILEGKFSWMPFSDSELIRELYSKIISKGLRPKTIVDYDREAFVFSAGNVRVTLDYNIRTGLKNIDFLNPKSVTIPAGKGEVILEVKWDEFLPEIIRKTVQLERGRTVAFSKYSVSRIYG